MDRADPGAGGAGPADVQQARVVGRGAVSAPVSRTHRSLSDEHGDGRVGVLHREGTAEAAALISMWQFHQVDSPTLRKEPLRVRRQSA